MSVPFSVRCVSCHGRLRVTDQALVGTIVACPRCGSMVQIAEPEPSEPKQSPPGPPPATSPADAPPSTARTSPPQPQMVVGSENVDSQEITQSDVLGEANALDDPQTSGNAFANSAEAPPVESGFARDPNPAAPDRTSADQEQLDWKSEGNWASEPKRRLRKQLLIGASALGGLIVIGVLAAWLLGGPDTPEPVAQHPPTQPAQNLVDEVGDDSETVPSAPPSPAPDPVAEETPAPSTIPAEEASDPLPGDTPPTELDAPAAPQLPMDSGPIPSGLLPVDILAENNDNSPLIPDGVKPSATGEDSGEVGQPLMEMPEGLEVFTQLLDLPGNAPDAPPVTTSATPVDDMMVEAAADAMLDPMLLATPPPDVNIDNALKFRVAIQTEGYPLHAFVLVCSELTQVPIQIDWVSLDLADISLTQPVEDAQPGWKPIGQLMDTIASQLGLIFEKEETRLFLSIGEASLKQRLADVTSLEDFGDEQVDALQWVDDFVDATEWDAREQIGLRALLVDCLRDARGIPQKFKPATLKHWSARAECLTKPVVPTPDEQDNFPEHWPLLKAGRSGPQLDTAITLAGILRQTSRVNNAACLVNWDDARQRRLTPGQLVLPYADQPAGEMLAKTLAPMGLQTRVADDSHWWVGTQATYDRMPLLVIGDELGPQRDQIMQRINEAAARTDTLILIKHDPVSDRYLSLMPRFLYRQLPAILKPFM
ncbi:hypothetical protein [Aporhodopirellula aestuarii]|uniref:Zinc finger/thioredoxin putative domain-containing protein n=1 Tax=Aporhodopirellula aestuarii TaxID=2950107 RepID=A0ABT0UE98_9BACT|nr:hypothetical protein [Aporhodopirellula aestuarii]MCM2374785.1 hypothetical protein [Aporhodopirellula aestuarii]